MGLAFSFLGVFMFSCELSWTRETVSFSVDEYEWKSMSAFRRRPLGITTFQIKFEGKGTRQILPIAYSAEEWRKFEEHLLRHFPEKEVSRTLF
mgnify:CR=1 FL=1